MRLSWLIPPLLVYSCYYWRPGGGMELRFYLDCMPLLIAGGYLAVHRLNTGWFLRNAAAALLLGTLLLMTKPQLQLELKNRSQSRAQTQDLPRVGAEVASRLRPDAVILTQIPFSYYLTSVRNFTIYDIAAFRNTGMFERAAPHDRGSSVWMQESRRLRLRDFYHAHTAGALTLEMQNVVRHWLNAGKQVVLLIPVQNSYSFSIGENVATVTHRLGPGFVYQTLDEPKLAVPLQRTSLSIPWRLVEIRLPAPATRPANPPTTQSNRPPLLIKPPADQRQYGRAISPMTDWHGAPGT